jgi:homoserine O-succinyltransferase/O-acetyltransferase
MFTQRARSSGSGTLGRAGRLERTVTTRFHQSDPTCVDIGLVNNMPDAALNATERQFEGLLGMAAGDVPVALTFYTLPEVRRTEFGRHEVSRYAHIDELWDTGHDGLIVTGTEPQAADLKDEPYWQSLTRVLEWAESHTYSTILSCLAAHAGVLHIDGIARRPLADKRFGVFECVRVSDHPLTADMPPCVRMPHSRWNEIPEEALLACGYRVLTRSEDAGVDAFMKQRRSLFVFLQGHPEYDATSLLLEYRRDIGRFLKGERDSYPPMPQGYFDQQTVDALVALQERAFSDHRDDLLANFPTVMATNNVTNTWRSSAQGLYRNWLQYIGAQKQRTDSGEVI